MSMRTKLIASFLLIVLTAIGIFVAVTIRQTAQEVNNFITRRGLTGSEVVVTELENYYENHSSWVGVGDILRSSPQIPRGMLGQQLNRQIGQNQNSPPIHLRLVDPQGVLMARTRPDTGVEEQRVTPFELNRGVPLKVDGEIVGYLLADVGQGFSSGNEISLLTRLNRAAIVAVTMAGVVAVVLALVLSYRLVRPVRELTQAASLMAAGDLSQRVDIKGKDELAALGQTFNHMAESLQVAEESRKAMTADIAHELRTPLAVQRAHLEAIEDKVYPLTMDALGTIEEQNKLLTRLVDDLGTLALVDAGELQLQFSETNLPDLIRRVTTHFRTQATERNIDINLDLVDCPLMNLDAQRIQQILHNLMSNALRYTPDGGSIQWVLNLRRQESIDKKSSSTPEQSGKVTDWIVLEVKDTGPGIPPEALNRIFDRFFRADKSRARVKGGTGLGLSIARKIAQAHGGDLTAANLLGSGAVFKLTLPIKS